MPDYEKMYFHTVHETERALNILIRAQQQCEEWYLEEPPDPPAATPCISSCPKVTVQATTGQHIRDAEQILATV